MPTSRSRSPVAHREERRRSASPRTRSPPRRRDGDRSRKSTGGFRWKEKRRDDDIRDGEDERRLERGYRERERDRDRGRYEDRERERDRDRERDRPRSPVADKAEKGDKSEKVDETKPVATSDVAAEKPKKEKKAKKSTAPAPTSEPMIIVNVNDRLGTKAAIPCLASDSVKLFKAYVAARIGREPHEIMLKRQGERPFKDALTLEDYGVSNGVQLDLEVDTGD